MEKLLFKLGLLLAPFKRPLVVELATGIEQPGVVELALPGPAARED